MWTVKLAPFIEYEWKSVHCHWHFCIACFCCYGLSVFSLLFSSLVVLILLHLLNVVLFAWSSLSVRSSPRGFSLHRFNHVSSSLHLSSRTAPVMVCSTMQLWAEMLLVPHQSTSCPVRCPRMCTAEWHNRSALLGWFWFASFLTLQWTAETFCSQTALDCN